VNFSSSFYTQIKLLTFSEGWVDTSAFVNGKIPVLTARKFIFSMWKILSAQIIFE